MKDPAFLFYPGDWQGGTMTLRRHLKGCYIDLLVAQFNSGPLSLEEIKTVLGNDFAEWGALSKKFRQTSEGLFFNERLDLEMKKRSAYSKSRSDNRRGKHMNDHMNEHMSVHMENENRNEDIIETFGKPENLLKIQLDAKTLEAAEMNQFEFCKSRNTDFIKAQWEIFKRERGNDPPLKQREYLKYHSRLYSHFLNWIRNKFPKHGTNSKHNSGGNEGIGRHMVHDKA